MPFTPGDPAALVFTGTQKLVIETPPPLNAAGYTAFTLEFWIRPDSLTVNRGVLGNTGTAFNANGFNCYLRTAANEQLAFTLDGTFIRAGAAPQGLWQHVACVYGAGTMLLYQNSNLLGTVAKATTNAPTATTFATRHGVADLLVGALDELRLWSVARTQADIQAQRYERLTGTEPGLLGYWPLNTFDPITRETPELVAGRAALLEDFFPPTAQGLSVWAEADLEDGGRGRIADSVVVEDVPAARRVRLVDRHTGRVVRETWSDPVTGQYAFERIALNREFIVYALDHENIYNAVIADRITAEPMP